MNCNSCGAQIPADSMFCPECGARQDVSASSGFAPPPQPMQQPNPGIPTFPGQQRNFDPVSGQTQRMQQDNNMQQMGQIPPDMLQGMAQGLHQQQNLPPGTYPQQPPQGAYPPNQFPPQQPQGNVMPTSGQGGVNDMPNVQRGPSLSSGGLPTSGNVSPLAPGGTKIAHNPANSPTDAMVNRLAEAERAVKDERRNQWLSMNQSPASSVLANLGGGELPAHLRTGAEGGNARSRNHGGYDECAGEGRSKRCASSENLRGRSSARGSKARRRRRSTSNQTRGRSVRGQRHVHRRRSRFGHAR